MKTIEKIKNHIGLLKAADAAFSESEIGYQAEFCTLRSKADSLRDEIRRAPDIREVLFQAPECLKRLYLDF